jgi:hypothetical protein
MIDALDSTATELGTDLEHIPTAPPVGLFRTDDPVEIIEQASRVADALKGILTRQGLTAKISGRDHVLVEGWTTLGSMLGVFAVKEWVRETPWPEHTPEALKPQQLRGLSFGYEASYRAQRADGTVIGGAEAECKRTESSWKNRDDYALKSMAQTRATSKALRVPLGFIVTLAGYEATPEAEIPTGAPDAAAGPPIGIETASNIMALIGDQLADNRLAPGDLPGLFAKIGAHPAEINAAAVDGLTEQQGQALLARLRTEPSETPAGRVERAA